MNYDFHTLHQTTLAQKTSCAGVGLHSGRFVTMHLYPAPADTGIVFKRTDVAGDAAIVPASYALVTDTMLGTRLTNAAGVSVSTIEHLMAALWGMGVDNAVIELDAAEVPIMDGSSEPFVDMLAQAGVVQLATRRKEIEVLEKITVKQGASVVSISPATHFSLSIEIDFPGSVIDRQKATYDFKKTTFSKALCRARTFGFKKDVDHLRAMGLALGGSLENAVVVGEDGVLNEGGLRFDDEFVRHKALDCVGDLFLAGRIRGHVTAYRPGHGVNNALLHALFADASNWRMVEAGTPRSVAVHHSEPAFVGAYL